MQTTDSNSSNSSAKKPKLTVYLSGSIDQVIQEVAERERRSKSLMATMLLEEALKARGYQLDPTP